MKKIIFVILLASTAAFGAEVCSVWVIEDPMGLIGVSQCTRQSDNLRLRNADNDVMARLSVIKALTERGYELNGDGRTMIKK